MGYKDWLPKSFSEMHFRENSFSFTPTGHQIPILPLNKKKTEW